MNAVFADDFDQFGPLFDLDKIGVGPGSHVSLAFAHAMPAAGNKCAFAILLFGVLVDRVVHYCTGGRIAGARSLIKRKNC